MSDRPRGGLLALCLAELVSWGLLYYSLPVAVTVIEDDTGWSQTTTMAALSAGLVVSAVAGIRVGRLLDAGGPRTVMTLGAVLGVVALLVVAAAPNLPVFYLGWLLAGLAQAATLYPPAFAVVTRWYGSARVRPLTLLTLVGGLASTVFAPFLAFLLDRLGWRMSYVVMAGILAVTVVPLHAFFLNRTWTEVREPSAAPTAAGGPGAAPATPGEAR
ncbi:MAG: MFS transporter, partial [Acidobacteria bacterium]